MALVVVAFAADDNRIVCRALRALQVVQGTGTDARGDV